MTAGDFTTEQDVSAYLGSSPSLDLNEIATLITNASQFIRTYCNDNFLTGNYTEIRDGVGYYIRNPTYPFANRPVSAISSVTVAGQTIQRVAQPPIGYQTGYDFTRDKLIFFGIAVPDLPLCVRFAYTAGVDLVPGDIAQVCIELVAQKYLRRKRIGVASEDIFGVRSVTYTKADLTDDMRLILNQRRRVAPISSTMPGST
jgi:hypothetical protein